MDRTKLLCCMKGATGSWLLALSLSLAVPITGVAHELSVQECREGADYIRNAALSRDNGMSEAHFMDIFDNDLAMLLAIPKALRWFVQDEDDAQFLRAALNEVFQRPKAPDEHAVEFVHACLAKAKQWDTRGKHDI